LVLAPVTGEHILAAIFKADGVLKFWLATIGKKRRIDAMDVKAWKCLRHVV
jgi:hypothetical protein